jgi:biopolymer transport protein ExbD
MMKVNGRAMERDELRDKLSRIAKFYPGQPVIIRADKDSRYESLMGVIDLCRSAEIWNFSLATDGDTEP